MAEEVGIVMTLYDRVSPTLKSIAGSNKAFDKSLDELEASLKAYDKAQTELVGRSANLKKAIAETDVKVREAQKSYRKLKDETSKGALDDAIDEQARLRRELSDTETAIKENSAAYQDLYKQARNAASAISKVDNRAGAGGGADGSGASMLAALGKAGLGQMAGDAAQEVANTLIGSAFGDTAGGVLSSGLSGTYNMVRLQAGQRDDLEIAVFDSRSGSLGIGIMVLQLWEEIVAGASWETLVRERAPHLVANTFPFFSVDTLEYLRRGGRIGRITALAGTMLSIKPIITFSDDGQLQSIAKVRGRRQVQDKILELLRARFQSGRRYNLAVANGGAPEEMAEFAARLKAEFPNYEHFWEGVMDATLSVYIGDGVIGGGIQFLD